MLPGVLKALHEQGVEIRGDAATCEVFGDALPATEADWHEEYLAPILAVRVVDDLDAAVDHIRRYGSDHTEVGPRPSPAARAYDPASARLPNEAHSPSRPGSRSARRARR